MSVHTDNPELIQRDIVAVLEADDYLATVAIVRVDPGDTAQDVEQKMAERIKRGGKRGVAVLVLPLDDAEDESPQAGFGPMNYSVEIQIAELVRINRNAAADGTLLTGRKVARRVLTVLRHYTPVGLGHNLVPEQPAIQSTVFDSKPGVPGWTVMLSVREADTEVVRRVARPILDPKVNGPAAQFTITCLTPDASIYYTTDESLPSATNGTLYTGTAVPVVGSQRVRARAYKTDWLASDTDLRDYTN